MSSNRRDERAASLLASPVVQIPAAIASEVAAALRVGIRELERRDALRFSPEVMDALVLLQLAGALRQVDEGVNAATDKSRPSGSVDGMDEVTPAEAARILGISRQAVAARITRKTLPSRRTVTGKVLIRRANLEES
jgi:hypothetical protein